MQVRCSGSGYQGIKIYYTVTKDYYFPSEIGKTVEEFEDKIATAIMDTADGEVSDWAIDASDECEIREDGLHPGVEYGIELSARVQLTGTCEYDPGRYYGPMEDCYPAEIYDVDLDEGAITDVDVWAAINALPGVFDDITAHIDDPDSDGDIEVDY